MREKIIWVSVAVCSLILAIGAQALYAEETAFSGEINTNRINLRSDATTSAQIIATLNKGERVEVVSESYAWYKIRLPKDVPVYVRRNLATCIKYTDNRQGVASPLLGQCLSAKILKDHVNLRARPSEDSSILGVCDQNEIVNVISINNGWYKIEPLPASFGWVHKKFVDRSVSSAKNLSPVESPEHAVIFTGTVEPYGMVFMRRATHKLVTKDNGVFLLKGNRASLNALNHQKVKVTGTVISEPGVKYPLLEVKVIEAVN